MIGTSKKASQQIFQNYLAMHFCTKPTQIGRAEQAKGALKIFLTKVNKEASKSESPNTGIWTTLRRETAKDETQPKANDNQASMKDGRAFRSTGTKFRTASSRPGCCRS